MSDRQLVIYSPKRRMLSFRWLDIFMVVVCLFAAFVCVYFFYLSLTQTLTSSLDPVGTVTIRFNSVQRRMGDRVLWDRIFNESPLYPGDIIRVAEYSGAVLHFEGNQVELEENTLIRVTVGSGGQAQIELSGGTLNLVSGEDSGNINLVVGGRTVEAGQGTALSVTSADEGMVLKVSEGSAMIVDETGEAREAAAGTVIAQDAEGIERFVPSVVVVYPRPNVRILKNNPQPLNVTFAWNGVNIERGEDMRLEVSADRNFNRIETSINAFDAAQVSLNSGVWNWRLLYLDEVLHNGRFTITEAAGPALISPVMGNVYRYSSGQPEIRFQWSAVEEAAFYILEVSSVPNFASLRISTQVWGASFSSFDLAPGVWYWRVRSVFPSNYEGEGGVSSIASFQIEQIADNSERVTESSEQIIENIELELEPPPPPPPPPLAASVLQQPVDGYRIGPAEIRTLSSIGFSWSAVSGANAYILTIFHETANGRRQLVRTEPLTRTNWTLVDFNLLDVGAFVWQVEAINMNTNGTIQRRGTAAQRTFTVDIPAPQIREQTVEGRFYVSQ